VRFTLKGVNEVMDGSGTFLLGPDGGGPDEPGEAGALHAPAAKRDGFFTRLLTAIARFFFRRTHQTVERTAPAAGGAGVTRLTFQLELQPGGPMGPMINALVKPLLMPAAEDLSNQIMAHLEKMHAPEFP
jgi:hypothetical protein